MNIQENNIIKYLSISLLFILIISNGLQALTLNITNPANDSMVLNKDFIVNFNIQAVNTYANCTISREAVLMYGKANLSQGMNFFLVSKDGYNFSDGYRLISISCTDLTETKTSSIVIFKTTPNEFVTLYDVFVIVGFVSIFISVLLFFPLGILKHVGLTNPIHYGMISIILMTIILLSMSDFNWFYQTIPYLYYLGVLIGFGNVFFSIPDYVYQKLEEIKQKKLFGDKDRGRGK